MSLEYQNGVNFVARGSDDSISGKVSPFGISQEMKAMRINNQLKWSS
jgi:hypothetical protein